MTPPVLEVVGVKKRYGPTVALDGVTLTVGAGELFGLLGPNGAGKTTLMSILSGLLDPTEGEVRLFGEPFRSTDRDRRRLVGLATQDLAIYPELTARENLFFFGRLYGMNGHDLKLRVEEMLAAVALTDRADQSAGTFSGGMKRRLNLAVAVIHRPKLLLLDEPTTGVDPQSRNHIFEQVKKLNATGLTVVYTSHYMEEVQTLCPRIAIVDNGKVKACDTVTNLLRRLETTARVSLNVVPPTLAERAAQLPGIKRVVAFPDRLEFSGRNLAPVLPKFLALCSAHGAEPTAIEMDSPNLERVFLHLTGHELRD